MSKNKNQEATLLGTQESVISSTKRTLARALKIEVARIKVGHNYKKNAIELQVEGKLEDEKAGIVVKAQDYLQSLLQVL